MSCFALLTFSGTFAQNYPNYNTNPLPPDTTGMQWNAQQLAAKMNVGWNIGNSLEATGGETSWSNPMVTKELIDLVKKSGFNAIRIPCGWDRYANQSTAEIDKAWLKRVKEVVDYCIQNDLYALLNIHFDGGWLEKNIKTDVQDKVNAKQKAYWEQIATYFRDYDERLLFASANEPDVETPEQMKVLLRYHQTFVDVVRATGGKNTYRCIIVQGPSTDFEKTYKLMNELPVDKTPKRMMVEVHYYTPWVFCGLTEDASWGKAAYYWGKENKSTTDTIRNSTWGVEVDCEKLFGNMNEKFVKEGIPVILGEFGALKRLDLTGESLSHHLASRAIWIRFVTKTAKANGCVPFYWDEGGIGNKGMGFFNRNTNKIADYQGLNAIIQGAK